MVKKWEREEGGWIKEKTVNEEICDEFDDCFGVCNKRCEETSCKGNKENCEAE